MIENGRENQDLFFNPMLTYGTFQIIQAKLSPLGKRKDGKKYKSRI